MSIAAYIREIGRGREGARALSREQASDLLGQVLDGRVSDLEIGAFCIAMRIKGETPEEMAGFLDATHARLSRVPASGPVVVLPSYNGARRLPVLTPLLAFLLARGGAAVLVHGTPTEDARIPARSVFEALGLPIDAAPAALEAGQVRFVPTEQLHEGLHRLLAVRRQVGLRNPAHSLVKLMNPAAAPALVVGSYTHPEYAASMTATFRLTGGRAMLLRGTEGEPVADARRTPRMDLFRDGEVRCVQPAQEGPLTALPDAPATAAADETARWIERVLQGRVPVPTPIALQVEHILRELATP